jgi:hypothetical protein
MLLRRTLTMVERLQMNQVTSPQTFPRSAPSLTAMTLQLIPALSPGLALSLNLALTLRLNLT